MTEISELERRITAALDRISTGVEGLGGGDAVASEALQSALDDEKMANAQLEERVRSLKDQHDAQLREAKALTEDRMVALESEVAALRAAEQETKSQNRALRQSNQRLQASLQQLRETGAATVEPHLLNQAMMSELEGLRAARASDRAEIDEILGALKPLVTENADA